MNYPYVITNKSVTVFIDGKPSTFDHSHKHYARIVDGIKNDVSNEEMKKLANIPLAVEVASAGRVKVLDNNQVMVDGQVLHNALTTRIVKMIVDGFLNVRPWMLFLDHLEQNPEEESKKDVFGFLERNNLPITPDGCFLAYKFVNTDYTDCYSGTMDNSIGTVVTMKREDVLLDRNIACAPGLHCCSYGYLPSYGVSRSIKRVIVVKVNPRDVVSVPTDHNYEKLRCCRYEVVSEIFDWDVGRITSDYTDEYDDTDIEDTDIFADVDGEEFDDDLDGLLDEETVTEEPSVPLNKVYSQKLDEGKVIEICNMIKDDWTNRAIAESMGISERQVGRIRNREAWVHITTKHL